MSISRTEAKKYIAKGIGAALNSEVLQMAEESLQRGFSDWNAAKNWYFLLKDTTGTTAVAGVTATGASASVNAPSTGAFDFVNPGQTVSISSGTATLTASAQVSSVTRNTSGVITSITLSEVFGGTTNVSATLTFSADIPLLIGVQDYNLPLDFYEPYHARMLVKHLPLEYIQYRLWNKNIVDHTVRGLPLAYTLYNPVSADTQNYGEYRLRVFRIPNGDVDGMAYDTLTLQYYRKLNFNSDALDIPDRYLYKFLDYCQWLLLMKKNAVDERIPAMMSLAQTALQTAMTDDEEIAEEEGQQRMISSMEAGPNRPPLWSNGQFSIYYGEL